MTSRAIEDLHPQTREKIEEFERKLDEEGIKFKGLDTYRSFAEQQALYDQGRTTPGRIVTRAKPGSSFHNVRRARDYALRDADDDFDNEDMRWQNTPAAAENWSRFGELAEESGLGWGGRWKRPDRPHVEDRYCSSCGVTVTATGAKHFVESGECGGSLRRRSRSG